MLVRMRAAGLLVALALAHAEDSPGLLVTATDGPRTAIFVSATPNFYLDAAESIHPKLDPVFRAGFAGEIMILRAGDYEFSLPVSIGDKESKRFSLQAGKQAIRIRTAGARSQRLLWKGDGYDWEPVSPSLFTHTGRADLAEEGRALANKLGCGSCHAGAGMKRAGPALDGIGSRVSSAWIYEWLGKPREGMPALLNDRERADVTAYLATLKASAEPKAKKSNEVDVGKGGELFGTLGCSKCHALSGLGSKYNYAALYQFVRNEHWPSMLLDEPDGIALAAFFMRSTDAEFERPAPAGNSTAGKAAFESRGCVACHSANQQLGPAVRNPECRVARYDLTPNQKAAITAYLSGGADRSRAPVYTLERQLRERRCLNCHGSGTEAPSLEGVGGKLKTKWIGQVLWGKARIRPSREMRMPHYEQAAVEPMAAAFAKMEGLAPGDGPSSENAAADRRTRGINMLGTNPRKQGMACIGCHDWGEYKSLGEEGPQLINAAERMRGDWFERWMRNPARILSGTSMPNYFGSSTMPAAKAHDMIATLWAGLELGGSAPVPDGYRTADLGTMTESQPAPGKESIVIRWDMPEATPAAIAVGLPGGKLSYCFDAGRSQLLYAWSGGFLDMTETLLKKTDSNRMTPTAKLVGEVFFREKEFPIRIGQQDRVPQRRFKGYRLVDGVPEFHYQVDSIDVYEKLSPIAGEVAIRRELRFAKVDGPVWFEGRTVPTGLNVKVEVKLAK